MYTGWARGGAGGGNVEVTVYTGLGREVGRDEVGARDGGAEGLYRGGRGEMVYMSERESES